MALLTIEGFEVPVLPGTEIEEPEHGEYARAYSGKMRSDIRARHRSGRILASYFSTDSDAPALLAILRSPGPVLCGGTMIGDDAYFHARNVRSAPITASTVQISCELHETDDTPSALLFSFDGDAPGTYTYTRTGTARYGTATGTLALAAANVLRRDWLWADGTYVGLPDTAAGLIEAARTNLVDTDDISAYTDSGTPVITASIDDPAGGLTAYRVEDNSGAASEYKYRTVTFTGDGVKSLIFVVREATMATSGNQQLGLWDNSASANRLVLAISAWTAGVPTVAASTGTYLGKRYVGNGYWALFAQTSSVTAANTNRVELVPAVTAAATGSLDVFRVNAYNSTVPDWSVLDASEARGASTWYQDYTAVPQTMTGLLDFVEATVPGNFADDRLFQIGNAADTGARLQVYRASGGDSYTVGHINAAGGAGVSATVDINPSWGNRIRIRWVLNSDGSVLIGAAKDTGAGFGSESVSSASSALALSANWGDFRAYLSHPAVAGSAAYINAKVVTGVRTMAEMRDWAGARLHPRIWNGGAVRSLSASVTATSTTVAAESP